MCLLKKIIKLFSKTIKIPEKNLNDLVYCFAPMRMSLNSTLLVPETHKAIMVSYGKAYEEFREGKYPFSVPMLPMTSKVNNLVKLQKNGTVREWFKGTLFFVNNGEYEDYFGNFIKVPLYDDLYKNAYGKIAIRCRYKIVNAKKFVQALALYNKYVSGEQAKECLWVFIEDFMTEKMSSLKLDVLSFATKNFRNLDNILQATKDACLKNGVEISELSLYKTILPGKVLRLVKEKNSELIFDEEDMEINTSRKVDIIVPENYYDEQEDEELPDNQNNSDNENQNNYDNTSQPVRLNEEPDFTSDFQQIPEDVFTSYKTCQYCGAVVISTAEQCYNCKSKL